MSEARRYRPSNGDEGIWFMAQWCERCERDRREDRPCRILVLTFALDVDDPHYPKEWVRDADGPRCTAFRERVTHEGHHRPPLTIIRDKRQAVLPL
jgi:hypothetical protein